MTPERDLSLWLQEIYENGLRHFEPVRWLGAEQLTLRVRAHDNKRGKEFEQWVLTTYSLTPTQVFLEMGV